MKPDHDIDFVKLEEINEDSLAAMKQQAEDVYHAKAAQDWGEGESLESFSYLGNYLLTSKNSQKNYLFLVYKAQVRNTYLMRAVHLTMNSTMCTGISVTMIF